MPSTPLVSTNHAYVTDTNGDYITAEQTTPNQPLVTPDASLTSNARHVIARSTGTAVVAASTGSEVYTRGGICPLVTDRPSLIVQPLPSGGSVPTTAFLTESGMRLLTESGFYLSSP